MRTVIPGERLTTCTTCKGDGFIGRLCHKVRCWVCSGRGAIYVGDFKPSRSVTSLRTKRTLEKLGVRA